MIQLETLLHRLSNCPQDFLEAPRVGASGQITVAAVVSDLLVDLGGESLTKDQAIAMRMIAAGVSGKQKNRLSIILICAWLLHDPCFRFDPKSSAEQSKRICDFITNDLDELAELVQAPKLVQDPDRREELARMVLKALGLTPEGETTAQSEDRLQTLSTTERNKVMREVLAAEERASEIRDAMQRGASRESAAAYGRE